MTAKLYRASALACAAMAAVAALAIAPGLRMPTVAAGTSGEPLPLRVVDAGVAVVQPIPYGPPDTPRRITVAMRVENPNAALAAEGIVADVRLLGWDGPVVETARVAIDHLLPGERRNIVARLAVAPELEGAVAGADVVLEGPAAWRRGCTSPPLVVQTASPLPVAGPPGVPGLSFITGVLNPAWTGGRLVGVRAPAVRATITNPTDAALADVAVAAIAFDRAGRIVDGGEQRYVIGPRGSVEALVVMTSSEESRIGLVARLEITAAYPSLDLASCE